MAIDEAARGPFVAEEWLRWSRHGGGRPFKFLDYRKGKGGAVLGGQPDSEDELERIALRSSESFAVSTLGQFARYPRVAALREFITDWYVSYLAIDATRGQPEAGPQARLSKTGDNLPNVIQYLMEQHPKRLETIFRFMSERIPRLEGVVAESMQDGRLLLQFKDAPFERPVLSKFASDGTLKMLAYLLLLHDPAPPQFIGVEEPENFLHPRLLPVLAEEFRAAAERSQMLVTTHSPFILNALRPEEVRILYRDEKGHSQVVRASDLPGVDAFVEEGAQLGQLWLEGQFGVGDPLIGSGAPTRRGGPR